MRKFATIRKYSDCSRGPEECDKHSSSSWAVIVCWRDRYDSSAQAAARHAAVCLKNLTWIHSGGEVVFDRKECRNVVLK